MTSWKSAKAKKVLAALEKIGWKIKRQKGSHKTLSREG
jgi:predicted RNA binding protein YcfA (HicA-like mRNA interferase family)